MAIEFDKNVALKKARIPKYLNSHKNFNSLLDKNPAIITWKEEAILKRLYKNIVLNEIQHI